jgi:AhpC/TSA family protein
VYLYVAYLALLQAFAQQPGVPLREDCSDSATVLANLAASAPVEVRSAIAGYEKVCYAVTVIVDGKLVSGYVQGAELVAVADFERRRAATAASIVNVEPAPTPAPGTLGAATAPPIPAEKPHYPPFRDFSSRDMKGRPVSARSLKGKVNLVCFWSPRHENASRELLVVSRLYGQFKQQGVDALAVSLSGDRAVLQDALDDFHLGFRNVPNGYNIAAKYNIDYDNLPRTYVLNENFEVIASGLHGNALEELVKKLVAAK